MKTITIKKFEEFIFEIGKIGTRNVMNVHLDENEDGTPKLNDKGQVVITGTYPDLRLFRGQGSNYKLIPKLGRENNGKELLREKELISEVKRRGDKIINSGQLSDWDLLVYVQHFGLETRLLDWTTNPLVALWFACLNEKSKDNAFVYLIDIDPVSDDILDLSKESTPFELKETKIFKPNLNNERIFAQNGWFTIHKYQKDARKFIPLEEEKNFTDKMWCLEIPAVIKRTMLRHLDMLGINYETIYPGLEGTCRYINWK